MLKVTALSVVETQVPGPPVHWGRWVWAEAWAASRRGASSPGSAPTWPQRQHWVTWPFAQGSGKKCGFTRGPGQVSRALSPGGGVRVPTGGCSPEAESGVRGPGCRLLAACRDWQRPIGSWRPSCQRWGPCARLSAKGAPASCMWARLNFSLLLLKRPSVWAGGQWAAGAFQRPRFTGRGGGGAVWACPLKTDS